MNFQRGFKLSRTFLLSSLRYIGGDVFDGCDTPENYIHRMKREEENQAWTSRDIKGKAMIQIRFKKFFF